MNLDVTINAELWGKELLITIFPVIGVLSLMLMIIAILFFVSRWEEFVRHLP